MSARDFFNTSYSAGQSIRRYPNEELVRFMGRRFFGVPKGDRRAIRILELGCGTGPNLRMLTDEGFDAYGVDNSEKAVELCQPLNAIAANMMDTRFASATFDAVVEVFSAYCLNEFEFGKMLKDTHRVLKPGGRFFSYTPSKDSECFAEAGEFIDPSTVKSMEVGPFAGNDYPFRFISEREMQEALTAAGFVVDYIESVGRTYGGEWFKFITVEAVKC